MLAALSLSNDTRTTAGILLITIIAVEYGGLTMLRIVRGHQPATDFQKSFARAGHAHACCASAPSPSPPACSR